MPGVVRGAVAVGTLPLSLSTKFTESHAVQVNINEYHDGTSQRLALVNGGRRTWKLAKRLDVRNLGLLRAFCAAVQGGAFFFFNPSETSPAFSHSPSGAPGMYLVRFNNDWSQINGMGRSGCDLEIIEVTSRPADLFIPPSPPHPPLPPPSPPPPSSTRFLGGGPVDAPNRSGEDEKNQVYRSYGSISYGSFFWTWGITGGSDPFPGAGVYKSSDGVHWFKPAGSHFFNGYPVGYYYDAGAATITLLIEDNPLSGHVSLVEFNLATETYGSQTGTTTLQSPSPEDAQHVWRTNLFKLSDGTFRLVYEVVNRQLPLPLTDTDAGLYFVDYAGATWTSPTVIADAAGSFYSPASVVQDGDTIHLLYADRGAARSNADDSQLLHLTGYQYVQIAAGGSISAPVTLDGVLGADGSGQWYANTGIISNDSILIPVAREFTDFTTPTKVGMLIGTPKSNPTWTFVQAGTVPSLRGPLDTKAIRLGSTLYLAWLVINTTTFNNSRIMISKSTDNGATWTTPEISLDLDATPPAEEDGRDIRDIFNFSLGTPDGTALALMYTSWATYFAPLAP